MNSLNDYRIAPPADKIPGFDRIPCSMFDRECIVAPAMAVLRKTFELGSIPENIVAEFTGECKFRLFINGHFIDDGPVEAGGDYAKKTAPDWWFCDRRNVFPFLHAGKNVIVVELINVPEAQTDYSTGSAGFALTLSADSETLLTTDSTWRVSLNPAYNGEALYDESKSIGNYYAVDFDDSLWPFAVKRPSQIVPEFLHLPPLREQIVRPIRASIPLDSSRKWIDGLDSFLQGGMLTIRPGAPVLICFEFAEEVFGHVEIEVESAGGAMIILEYREVPGVSCGKQTYLTAPGCHTHRFTRLYPMQFLFLTIACGQFTAIPFEPVKIRALHVCSRSFPLPEPAPFDCSDSKLVEIRNMIDRTMHLCQMRMSLDSPVHQEGLGCTADYRIQALISAALYGETRIACADLYRTARLILQQDGFMFHTSFSLIFIDMTYENFMFTGDMDFLRKIFPAVESVLKRFAGYVGRRGLVSEAPNYMFIDWINDGKFTYHHPPAGRGMGCLTAFYVNALRKAAILAKYLGFSNDYTIRADASTSAFNRELWVDSCQCYRDGVNGISRNGVPSFCPPDDGTDSYSVHTNALALAFGIVPGDKKAELVKKIMTDSTLLQPQPYFLHYVFEALVRTNTFNEYGFALLKRWETLHAEHRSSLKECWNCGDYSHAWGGTPAWQIARSILGIEPAEPGYRKIHFHPNFGSLEFAIGEVPTIHGPIHVRWNNGEVQLTLPAEIERID
jgi:alpha-L-rhamnosidase